MLIDDDIKKGSLSMNDNSLTIAALQLNSGPDMDSNLKQVEETAKEAVVRGAKLITLPENFAYFGSDEYKLKHINEIQDTAETFLKDKAKEWGVWFQAGGYPAYNGVQTPPHNRSSLISPSGKIESYYNKVHLFDTVPGDGVQYQESKSTTPGKRYPSVFQVNGWAVGTVICFDLRFPALFSVLREKGCELIVVPAAFTQITGEAHWEILLRARAIETQCYIIAPAQWGKNGNKTTYGHSMIIDPWGSVVSKLDEGVGFVTSEINKELIESTRKRIPMIPFREDSNS
jgi:predicted amidohydrolase